MAKDPGLRPTDATTFVADLKSAASGGYGKAWHEHGQSHLGEAALLLAALWPSGAPPTVQGTSVYRVPVRRRGRLWHALQPVCGPGPVVKTQPTAASVGAAVNIPGTNPSGATSVTVNGTAASFTVG